MSRFVHLHLHSEYALIDSTIRIEELVDRVAALRMPAVALTDEANLFALVKFYQRCQSKAIKPIVGADLWVRQARAEPTRLTLLCIDRSGYRNLSVLISRGYRERSDPERVVLQRDWVLERSDGLIALLGPRSEVGVALAIGHEDEARAALAQWCRAFADRTYLELVRVGHAGEDELVAAQVALAVEAGVPAIASNDVRFLAREDFEAHEARVCIHEGYALDDPKRPRHYSAEQYLKSPQEMANRFADLPEALANSWELAQRVNLELTLGKYFLPAYPTPAGASEPAHLARLAQEGLVQRLDTRGIAPRFAREDYARRLEQELGVIVSMGFAGYFLIVADFVRWAREAGIPVGPGRGSGAGSLVAYVLGITDLDPLRYDLLFERFLNPERVSMPDFDIDFCMDRRDEVIDYVARRYGREKVSQIITYGSMAAKAVLRDTGRVLGMPYGQVDRIAKTVPSRPLDIALDDALGFSEKAQKEPDRVSAEFRQLYDSDEEVRQLVDLARALEDLKRNAGKHAGGVVIAPSELTDFAPLYAEARSEGMVTQFDKDDVEAVGLVKFDFLGLRTLTIIDWAVKAINRTRAASSEAPLDIARIPLEDPAAYELLKRCNTTAVFQFESRGMKEMLRKLAPDVFDDIISAGALYRPGPLQSGMVDEFIDRKHGRKAVSYPHPKLEPILKPTYGVIVYQEQVMQIAQVLAGYSLGGADLLRRAMGKKKADEMAKERVKFEAAAGERGVDARLASSIFDLMEKFAEYGFNKSHSAAYALVSYQTAWLKAHYAAEFMAAVLSSDMDNTDKVVNFLDDARAQKLSVLAPEINSSDYAFEALDARTIRYGLGAVKGVGRGAVDAIVAARAAGPFTSLLDFCQRIDAQRTGKRVLEALLNSGALDGLDPQRNRGRLAAQLPEAMRAAEQRQREREAGQSSLFGFGTEPAAASSTAAVQLPDAPDWSVTQKLAGEREVLGHYLSGHPTDACRVWLEQLASAPIGKLDEIYRPPPAGSERRRGNEQLVAVAGLVAQVRRRGDQMAFVQLEDGSGRIEVGFFRDTLIEFAPLLTRDRVLVIEGGLTLDEFSGDLQLRARQVWTLDEACERFARQVRVAVNGVGAEFSERLAASIAAHRPGNTPLRLELALAAAGTELELGESWRVRATPALLEAIASLAGIRRAELILTRATGAN
jgi:DNA polymerase-3 subunit alpha